MYPLFLSDFNQNWISRQIFEKSSNIKFPENLSSDELLHADGQTGRSYVTLRNFVNTKKNSQKYY